MTKSQCFRLAFEFYDRWKPYPATPEDWQAAAQEMSKQSRESNSEFLRDLLADVYMDFDRERKARKVKLLDSERSVTE